MSKQNLTEEERRVLVAYEHLKKNYSSVDRMYDVSKVLFHCLLTNDSHPEGIICLKEFLDFDYFILNGHPR